MSRRPLVLVTGLAIADYLLWNWSLNGNHDVLALVAGLTLPPLAVAAVWLIALHIARLIAASARRPRRHGRIAPARTRVVGTRARQPAASVSADAASGSDPANASRSRTFAA